MHRGFVKEVDEDDIRRITLDFVAAAKRCREGNLDGIELLATSHLLGQFLSPAIKKRSDRYGGSLENRVRLTLQVLEAIRAEIGRDLVISLRLTGDEMLEGGLTARDCIDVSKHVARSGLVDVLNVLGGNAFSETGMARNMPGMDMRTAPYLGLAAGINRPLRCSRNCRPSCRRW